MEQGLHKLLLVGSGGALGALARYGIAVAVLRATGWAAPLSTLLVNVAGCFAIGALVSLAEARAVGGEPLGLFLRTGLLGGFTTFSAFGLETFELARADAWGLACANALANLLLGLGAVAAGFVLTRACLH